MSQRAKLKETGPACCCPRLGSTCATSRSRNRCHLFPITRIPTNRNLYSTRFQGRHPTGQAYIRATHTTGLELVAQMSMRILILSGQKSSRVLVLAEAASSTAEAVKYLNTEHVIL